MTYTPYSYDMRKTSNKNYQKQGKSTIHIPYKHKYAKSEVSGKLSDIIESGSSTL